MTKQVAIELLKQGNNGEEILSILDALMSDESQEVGVTDFNGNAVEF